MVKKKVLPYYVILKKIKKRLDIQGDICDECKAKVADNKCFVIAVGEDQCLKRYIIVSKDVFTQKVEGCAVLMKEADFNVVFDKH